MRNREKEFDDYPDEVYASEKEFFKRFRILEGDELAEHKRRIAKAISGGPKKRVTIYLDANIVSKFKEDAEKEKIGYQTLINDTLRRVVDSGNKETKKQNFKDEMLKDKKFLRKLKTALAT